MSTRYPYDPARDALRLSSLVAPFAFVSFAFTLLTDIAFWRTSDLMWQNFSSWLLFAGLVAGGLALVAGLVDLARQATRENGPGAAQIVGFLVVLVLALFNSLVHSGDGWTAVVPNGIILSAVTVVAMIVTLWLGRRALTRGMTGVRYDD
ncbi:DUF2231 domain-containing protein [Aureimonas glaciei]|jgi:uncharacterized membrane protein|uniref:Membrane protein n=1 Tax=Aureimonas glaciei TaxID=1776957 RepID=A0A916XUT6_9HYPH|nr:DUF2231 domain-containing protein [Aureimonas glaciei]GGD12951.1 membrane protein [Aureimonas glaciei]